MSNASTKPAFRLRLSTDASVFVPGYENPRRVSAHTALRLADVTLEDCGAGIVPACCADGCFTDPDGECEHGHPSVLTSLGLI